MGEGSKEGDINQYFREPMITNKRQRTQGVVTKYVISSVVINGFLFSSPPPPPLWTTVSETRVSYRIRSYPPPLLLLVKYRSYCGRSGVSRTIAVDISCIYYVDIVRGIIILVVGFRYKLGLVNNDEGRQINQPIWQHLNYPL